MNHLRPDHIADIERILGSPLSTELLVTVERPESLSRDALDIVRRVAKESRQLAFKYLREVVPGERIGLLMVFLEKVIDGQ
jgi:predicted DNA-binding transcriptional regulator YafY